MLPLRKPTRFALDLSFARARSANDLVPLRLEGRCEHLQEVVGACVRRVEERRQHEVRARDARHEVVAVLDRVAKLEGMLLAFAVVCPEVAALVSEGLCQLVSDGDADALTRADERIAEADGIEEDRDTISVH